MRRSRAVNNPTAFKVFLLLPFFERFLGPARKCLGLFFSARAALLSNSAGDRNTSWKRPNPATLLLAEAKTANLDRDNARQVLEIIRVAGAKVPAHRNSLSGQDD
jgi:hypothetical protein